MLQSLARTSQGWDFKGPFIEQIEDEGVSSAKPDSGRTCWLGAGDHTSWDGPDTGCLLGTLFQALQSGRLSLGSLGPWFLHKTDE